MQNYNKGMSYYNQQVTLSLYDFTASHNVLIIFVTRN